MVDVLLRFLFESEGRTEVRVIKVSLIIIFISYRFGIIKEENTQNLDYALIMVTVKEYSRDGFLFHFIHSLVFM